MCIYISSNNNNNNDNNIIHDYMTDATRDTPSSHSKNSLSKICSKGWVALQRKDVHYLR